MFSPLTIIAIISIGIILGILGAGGSIITLPVLTYLVGLPIKEATSYSLVIVGVLAFLGFLHALWKQEVDLSNGFLFALPSLITVYLTRAYLMPIVPEILISIVFIVLITFSSFAMLRPKGIRTPLHTPSRLWSSIDGAVVGMITGLVGAGGGFLIVPALIFLCGLSPKIAVGTSLFIITLKSLVGVLGDIQMGMNFSLPLLSGFIGIGALGITMGVFIRKHLSEQQVARGFAIFLLIMAVIMGILLISNFG